MSEQTTENSAQKQQSSSNKPFVIITALVAAVVVSALLYSHYYNRVTTDDAQIDGHFVTVSPKVYGTIEKVFITDNQVVHAGDLIVKIDDRDYQAKVDQASATVDQAAAVLSIARTAPRFAQAALIRAQALLEKARFSQAKFESQLASAKAELAKSHVSFKQAKSSDWKVAEANVDAKMAVYEKARTDLERMRPLAERQEISKQQLDSYVTAFDVAESDLKAVQRKLNSVQQEAEIRGEGVTSQQAKVAEAEAEVEQAKAEMQKAEADLEQARVEAEKAQAEVAQAEAGLELARANLEVLRLQLSYTTIKAPIDGVVTARTVEEGQNVQPGQGLMVLISPSEVWVTANYKETQLAEVKPGQKADIYVDLSGKVLHGKVDSISGSTGARMSLLPPENAVGNFVKVVQRIPVKIVFDENEAQKEILRLGMNVEAIVFVN